jgi:hypothetical protein
LVVNIFNLIHNFKKWMVFYEILVIDFICKNVILKK